MFRLRNQKDRLFRIEAVRWYFAHRGTLKLDLRQGADFRWQKRRFRSAKRRFWAFVAPVD